LVDILAVPELRDSTISLMDINSERLAMIEKIAKRLITENDFPTKIETTTNRKKALKDANYVIAMIQVGGLEAYKLDIEIPNRYGVNQAVGDTLGPGGVFRGLRTIPVYLNIAREMEELCPEALFLNYVNPMAINCLALTKATSLKNVGLCHSVQGTAYEMSQYLNLPYQEINYISAGINHMAWYLKFEHQGKDLYPELKKKYDDPDIYQQDVTKFEFLKHFGYFVTESTIHMSEYVPYFRKSKSWISKIHKMQREDPANSYGGDIGWTTEDESGAYLHVCQVRNKTYQADMEKLINSKIEIKRSNEYGSRIIEAIETGRETVIHGNVSNNDYQISNLPADSIVEVPCLVNKNGIQPTSVGKLPTQLAALNRSNINVQQLAVEGALTGDKEKIYQAIMMDPLTGAVLTMDKIRAMVAEMFSAQQKWLPNF
jgi:alpha-galactosidase